MMTDPIADLLVRIQNASQKNHEQLLIRFSKLKHAIVQVLQKEGFVEGVEIVQEGAHSWLSIKLVPKTVTVKRISKPGRRMYIRSEDLKTVKNGFGITILSTSQGVMSNKDAYKKHIGGELLCEIY